MTDVLVTDVLGSPRKQGASLAKVAAIAGPEVAAAATARAPHPAVLLVPCT